jgi:F0F1-type ATP synthase epsilon subunit
MAKDRPFRCEIMTPQETVCDEQTVGVTFRAVDGDMGVLANRSPLVAKMGAGRLLVERPDGDDRAYYASGGFAHMRDNVLTVLAEDCVPLAKLDPEEIWDELQRVRDWPVETDRQRQQKADALEAVREKFRLAQQERRRQREAMGILTTPSEE